MNARQAQRAALRRAYPFKEHFVEPGADGMPDTETWSAYLERQECRAGPLPERWTAYRVERVDFEQARN